jgi:hypothetical protein
MLGSKVFFQPLCVQLGNQGAIELGNAVLDHKLLLFYTFYLQLIENNTRKHLLLSVADRTMFKSQFGLSHVHVFRLFVWLDGRHPPHQGAFRLLLGIV